MNKRAILYARVSTEAQVVAEYILKAQITAVQAYAQANDFEVVEELQDVCSSEIPISERPAGKRIYDLVESESVGAVIAQDLSRLTSREYLRFKRCLRDKGVELHFANTGVDAHTKEADLVGFFQAGLFAETYLA